MANQLSLSEAQLGRLWEMIANSDKVRIVVEETNLEGTVVARLDGKVTLIATSGNTYEVG